MLARLGRFEMPKSLTKDEASAAETYAKFIAEPFEAGYGQTVGNSLREFFCRLWKELLLLPFGLLGRNTSLLPSPGSLRTLPTSS